MMWNWDTGMWGAGLGMLIWAVLLIAVIALAVVLVARAVRSPQDAPARRSLPDVQSPEDELRMRLARGELDSDEFRRRMQDLREL